MGFKGILLLAIALFSFHIILCFSNNLGGVDGDDVSLNGTRDYPKHYGALDGEEEDQSPYGFIRQSSDDVVGVSAYPKVVSLDDYGAYCGGSDYTKAMLQAWSKVCSSSSPAVLTVPANQNYLIKPITFSGPCKSNVSVMVEGTIQAPSYRSAWDGLNQRYWILFQDINNLHVGGGGTINGNGQVWWQNSCKNDKSQPCKDAPTAITFHGCNHLVVDSINVKNSQQIHMQFQNCNDVRGSSITISAPGNSPNTDGIHITGTQNIHLDHCNIGTGDDCISIVSGSQGVRMTNTICGPGHGISIGSLGAHGSYDYVSDVTVDTAQFKGTTNGLRIKTWQGGSGYAKHIQFLNVNMINVQNPIIIDQSYCDSHKPCYQQKSAVQVSDVLYYNVRGKSASNVAIDFGCSKNFPCQDIVLQEINLVNPNGGAAKSSCENVQITKIGTVIPLPCA